MVIGILPRFQLTQRLPDRLLDPAIDLFFGEC
jgi:hypothetical protein